MRWAQVDKGRHLRFQVATSMKLRQETELYNNNLYLTGRKAVEHASRTAPPATAALSTNERKVERVLATARALLAFSLLAAIYLAPRIGGEGFTTPIVLAAYC